MGPTVEQSEAAVQSMAKALQGAVPDGGDHSVKIARDTWMWKEYRSSTKQLICALTNSLRQYLPDHWTLASLKPGNLLAPRTSHGERVMFLRCELETVRDDMNDHQLAFIHDKKSGLRFADWYLDETAFYKLTMCADEGTEVLVLPNIYK